MHANDATYLLDRYQAALTLYARQFCLAAEDVVQEVFVSLCQQSTLPANPAGWLFRATRNRAISQRRAEQRRQKHEVQSAERREWFEKPQEGLALDAQSAEQALQQLPEEQREVIIAHLWGGMTFEEIAQALGGSATTHWRRYTNGISSLRQTLESTPPISQKH